MNYETGSGAGERDSQIKKLSEVDQCFYREELKKLRSGIQKNSLYNEDNVKQQVERTEQFQKAGKWEKSPKELIKKTQKISGAIPGFHVKEIYHGISPFAIFLVPQVHEVDEKMSNEAKRSQHHIKELLPFLEKQGLSNVNLLEGTDMSYPHYAFSSSGLYLSVELQQKSSDDSMRFDPQYADRFMNFHTESEVNPGSDIYEEAVRRNRQIMSNILMRSEATPANAFTLILGAAHFQASDMRGADNTIQAMLRQQGISYILLESDDPSLR